MPQFTDIVAIIGLPRSGTTLAASLFDAHPATVTCYEPWNRSEGKGLQGGMSPQDLISRFKLERNSDASIFVLKETSVDFQGLQWLAGFLAHNAKTHKVRVVWSLRCYRHTYLSFVEGARKWWGHTDRQVGADDYNRWVRRAAKSTDALIELYQKFPGAVYAYEALTSDPDGGIPRLMSALELPFSERQLDYRQHIAKTQIRGDISMSKDLRPVSSQSVDKREQEWQRYAQELTTANYNPRREGLDIFWQTINDRFLLEGRLSEDILALTKPHESTAAAGAPQGHEFRAELANLSAWVAYIKSNPEVLDEAKVDKVAADIASNGFHFRGEHVPGKKITNTQRNFREGFSHAGLNSRKRAVLAELYRDLSDRGIQAADARVYAPEALSGFSSHLRESFVNFQCSEYIPDLRQREQLAPIQHQDLSALTYANNSFDYVLVNDIFEHVPDLNSVFAEIARVLAPGGALLSTFPFAVRRQQHLVKAKLLENGEIEYLTEPEYHQDPVDKKGALVFKVPGWDVLNDCTEHGFSQAHMVFLCSPARGIIANSMSGILVLKAVKAA